MCVLKDEASNIVMPVTFENPGSTTEAVLSLGILGPITLYVLSWDLQFHACYLFTEDPI